MAPGSSWLFGLSLLLQCASSSILNPGSFGVAGKSIRTSEQHIAQVLQFTRYQRDLRLSGGRWRHRWLDIGHTACSEWFIQRCGGGSWRYGISYWFISSEQCTDRNTVGFYESEGDNTTQIPAMAPLNSNEPTTLSGVNPNIDWMFLTTPQVGGAGRRLHYARGKCLGGSSGRNYMLCKQTGGLNPDLSTDGILTTDPRQPRHYRSDAEVGLSSGRRKLHLGECAALLQEECQFHGAK